MPTYNHAKTIGQAIESVLMQQTDFDWEMIISNDASTDETPALLADYARKDARIRVINKERNEGLIRNYLTLISEVRGTYIAILESDDYWTDKQKLQKQVDALRKDEHLMLSFTRAEELYDDGHKQMQPNHRELVQKRHGLLYSYMIERSIVCAPTLVMRTEAVRQYCRIEEYAEKGFVTFDYPVIMSLAAHGGCHYTEDVTAVYRVGKQSISNAGDYHKRMAFEQGVAAIRSYIIERWGTGGLTKRQVVLRQAVVLARVAWRYKRPATAAYVFFHTLIALR